MGRDTRDMIVFLAIAILALLLTCAGFIGLVAGYGKLVYGDARCGFAECRIEVGKDCD